MKPLTNFFRPLLSLGAFMGIWSLASLFFEPYVLPSPLEIVEDFDHLYTPDLLDHLRITLLRVIAGFMVSFAAGTSMGILGHVLKITPWVEGAMMMVQVIPGVILGVILLLLVGQGSEVPVMLIIVLTTPLIAMNTGAALARRNPSMEGVILSFGGTRRHLVKDLYLPMLVPAMRSNAGIGMAMAVKVVVLGEFIATDNGLGYLINMARIYFNMADVLFYVMIILVLILGFQLMIDAVFFFFLKKYFYPG
ncbi:ABC transporter permease [Desulforapulum autotrophicum]|nr:ABC transporter permease subunit [Desulforapulum autotrophicum]